MAGELVARRAVRSGALWGWVFGAYVAASALGFASLYKTQQARDELAHSFGSNIGITALVGPAHEINTAAGFTVWRSLGALSLVGSIWGLLTATRLLRGEEDAGRWELLLAGRTTQRRATAQALVGLAVGVSAMFAVTALITVAVGRSSSVRLPLGAALYFSLTLVAGAAVFLAIGALTSQLVSTRRRAASIAGAVFGASFALRMVADSNPSIHWLVWASPLGWVEETRPLTDPHPWVLVPIVALVLVAAGLALHLAGTRDIDAAVLPDRDVARPRTAWLGSPAALAARLMRPQVVSWLVADAAFALLLGVVAKSGADATTSSSGMTTALARIGFRGAAIDEYLGLTFLIVASMVACIAAGHVSAASAEETEGRLDHLLVRPVSRARWLVGRLALAVSVLVVAGLVAGLLAWAGAATQGVDVGLGSLLAAGLNVVPPSVLLLGVGTLVYGARPRLTPAAAYGYLAWSFLVELLGSVVHLSHWALDTSMFFHMAPAPAAAPNWTSAAVLVAVGTCLAAGGVLLLRRRDVGI